MRVLITGGCGFIGSWMVRRALREPGVERVVNLDCLTYAGTLTNVRDVMAQPRHIFEEVDVRDRTGLDRVMREHGVTHVLHLAAESHVDRSIHAPSDFITTNVLGTFHLLEACRGAWSGNGARGCRFVHVSTDEVYGSLGAEGLFTEDSPMAPSSPYSASKASADLLVRAYHRTYGLPTVSTNCSNNYGPCQFPEKLIPVVVLRAAAGESIPVYGNGLQVRDWLHVEDHCEALWQVLSSGRDGATYNIGARNEWTNMDLVRRVCGMVDEFRGDEKGRAASRIVSVTDRPGHDVRYAIDPGRIEQELGWRPVRRFEEGLRETVWWYLGNRAWVEEVLGAKARCARG